MAQTVSRPGSEEYGRRLVAQLATLRHCREMYKRYPTGETQLHIRRAETRLNELIADWCRARILEQAEDIAAGGRVESE